MSKRTPRRNRADNADSLWPVGLCRSENVLMAVTLGLKHGEVILEIRLERKLADGSTSLLSKIGVPLELVEPLTKRLREARNTLNQLPGMAPRSRKRRKS